jgi:hypothetical protein
MNRCWSKAGALILTLAVIAPSADAQESAAPPAVRPSKHFNIDDFERMSDQVWKEKGPFGIFLEDQVPPKSDRMKTDPTSFDDLAFYTAIQSGDEELYLASVPMFRGGKPTGFILLSHGKYGDRTQLHTDGKLLRAQLAEKIDVIQEKNRVVWSSPSLQTIAQPPVWHVLGSFKDQATQQKVDIDLLYKQYDQEYLVHWPAYNPGRTGRATHAPLTVEGAVYIDGKKYAVDKGFAVYERVIQPSTYSQTMGRQDWFNGFCEDVMNFQFFDNGYGASQAFLSVKAGDKKKYYSFGAPTLAVTDTWLDPRLNRKVPSAWRVTATAKGGKFEAAIKSYAPHLLGTAAQTGGFDIYHHLVTYDAKFTPSNGPAVEARCIGTNEARFEAPGVKPKAP